MQAVFAAAALLLPVGLYSPLETTHYTVKNGKILPEFDGYRIVQISDFHLRKFGEGEETLIAAVLALGPDLIVLTGDVMDRRHGSMQQAEELLRGIAGAAPVYAVAGNHEYDNPERFEQLREMYLTCGVVYLEGQTVELRREEAGVFLCAPRISRNRKGHFWADASSVPADAERYTILLNHFSNDFDRIAPAGFDLVLAGHTHGGIVRLPYVGGVFGNDGDLFPRYDGGVYRSGGSTMVSSRGLGDAGIPRFFNSRELVCVTLESG